MSGGWQAPSYGQAQYGSPRPGAGAPPAQLSKGEFSVGSQSQDWYWYHNM